MHARESQELKTTKGLAQMKEMSLHKLFFDTGAVFDSQQLLQGRQCLA